MTRSGTVLWILKINGTAHFYIAKDPITRRVGNGPGHLSGIDVDSAGNVLLIDNWHRESVRRLITLSGLMVTLFLGGWGGPGLPGPLWFAIKLAIVLFVFMWMRGTLPRVRIDQLMGFAWKWLLPAALLNLFVTAAAVVVVGS